MLGLEISLFSSIFLFFATTWFLLFPIVASQIRLGSRLSVEEQNSWVSSNGDFAIGFFNRSNQYAVGIRFHTGSIPIEKQTVVWTAGANLLVGDKSYFQLTQDGELTLFDSVKGVVVWASKTTNSSVSSASLLDNGNLVLFNKKNDIVWQSFDTPSDTLLPGQNFSTFRTLRAASRNSVSSYYTLHMDVSGHLQLKWESNVVYWNSGTSPSQSGLRAILTSDGTFHLLDQKSSPVWSVFGEDHDDSDVKFRFLRLDVDGNLRLYSWLESSSSWESVWQAVANPCNIFATCGLSGICVFSESGIPVCKCPFSPTSQSGMKCLVPYQQDCRSGSSMVTYNHTFLYAIYPPNETITISSLEHCKSLCQEDPLCTAATFTNDGTAQCRIKKTQYVSGRSGSSLSSISFVKRCSDPIAVFPVVPKSSTPPSPEHTTSKKSPEICVRCVIGVAAGTFFVFIVFQLGIGIWIYRRRRREEVKVKASSGFGGESYNPSGFVALSYLEIKDLTENFKHQIGPKMFKGKFPDHNPVVVKDVNSAIEERKFRSGVLKLGGIHHKSLVKMEGYCCESDHRFLVYEFIKNGSVLKYLEDPKMCTRLTWKKRMEICLTVARAISYLHTGCREFLSHGDLRCENVVLDENLEAKVTEYGLASVLKEGSDSGGPAERDVRDFGKFVLALVNGSQNGEDDFEWAYEKWEEGLGQRIVDSRLEEDEANVDEVERTLRIAFWCLQLDERMRPTMGEVVKVLDGTLPVDPPPPLFACKKLLGEEEEGEETGSDSEA